MTRARYDVVVIGAGIVGLASALALRKQDSSLRLAVLEKEAGVAYHQTGHNSGVMHAGIYYAPGSLKARLCREGVQRLMELCDLHGVRYERCGKVIVATSPRELGPLEELERRGRANGVPGLRRLSQEQLRRIEPHAAGIEALHSPTTAIVDYREVARAIAAELAALGVDLLFGRRVEAIEERGEGLHIMTPAGSVRAAYLVNCAGLYADVIARTMGVAPQVQIIPFRGEYYLLRPERRHLVRGLIYPVPDPNLPFLGVHVTPTVHGEVEAGPNAVLALAREGYRHTIIRPRELFTTLTYPGFRLMARRFWRTGIDELRRSLSKGEFAHSLQRLVPEIRSDDLVPGGAGVRAQAVGPDGTLVDDFTLQESSRAIHVLNAPSPAATASLAIGEHIARLALGKTGQ